MAEMTRPHFPCCRAFWPRHLNEHIPGVIWEEGNQGAPVSALCSCSTRRRAFPLSVIVTERHHVHHWRLDEHKINLFLAALGILEFSEEAARPEILSSLWFWALWHPTQTSPLWCRQLNHSSRPMSDSWEVQSRPSKRHMSPLMGKVKISLSLPSLCPA